MKDAGKVPQIGLRLPPDLRKWLDKKAAENHRSLNGEVVVAVEQYRKQQEAHAKTTS